MAERPLRSSLRKTSFAAAKAKLDGEDFDDKYDTDSVGSASSQGQEKSRRKSSVDSRESWSTLSSLERSVVLGIESRAVSFEDVLQAEAEAKMDLLRDLPPPISETLEENEAINRALEDLKIYHLNAHNTDCFTEKDEYVMARQLLLRWEPHLSSLVHISDEDVTLPCYFGVYDLGPHTTDCFTEADEYRGVAAYYDRLYPKTSDELLTQVYDLSEVASRINEHLDQLAFNEEFVLFSKEEEDIGETIIRVEKTTYEDQLCFHVKADSYGMIEGIPCRSKLSGHVTPSLTTLHLMHKEYLSSGKTFFCSQVQMIKHRESYTQYHIKTEGQKTTRETYYHHEVDMKNYISEAACVLLQRLLVLTPKDEEYEFNGMDVNCQKCKIHFKYLPRSKQVVQGVLTTILGLKKTYIFKNNQESVSFVYMNNKGQILNELDDKTMIMVKPKSLIEAKVCKQKFTKWENDMEMQSKFTGRKDQLAAQYQAFLEERTELRALLNDFLQEILLYKPNDVISFAAEYFDQFETEDLPEVTLPTPRTHSFRPSVLERKMSEQIREAQTDTSITEVIVRKKIRKPTKMMFWKPEDLDLDDDDDD